MTHRPRWTWLLLRYEARRYLGVYRLPNGTANCLRDLLGQPALDSRQVYVRIRHLRKPVNVV
jgi:hypothetical protein